MRYLILSDLHANLQALESVLADAKGLYDQVACLGDLVGYGPDPNDVTSWVRENVSLVIRGNHDRACVGDPVVEDFTEGAQMSTVWTMQALDPVNVAYLEKLPAGPMEIGTFHIVHGAPRHEDEYVVTKNDAINQYPFLPGSVCFFGHTHIQCGYLLRPGRGTTLRGPRRKEKHTSYQVESGWSFLLNPGSVGQPRDGDPRAAYALMDEALREVSFHRVAYDLEETQRRILRAGLPEYLALRLAVGR